MCTERRRSERSAVEALLRDGRTVSIRPIIAGDASALAEFHAKLAQHTVYLRFFGFHPVLSEREAAHFCTVDSQARFALVAEAENTLVGVARYDLTTGSDSAEVAFVVADAFQGQGLGTLLLEHLAVAARNRGISTFTAETLASNGPMQDVFRRTGFISTTRMSQGVSDVRFSIAPTQRYLDALTRRDWSTARPIPGHGSGGLAVIATSEFLRVGFERQCQRVEVTTATSLVLEPGSGIDTAEALAAIMGSAQPQAIAIAHAGRLERPRTFLARVREAAKLMPVTVTGMPQAYASQAGIELASGLGELATRSRELLAAANSGQWNPIPSGNISEGNAFDIHGAHELLTGTIGRQLLHPRQTDDLLAGYGILAATVGGGGDLVAVASAGSDGLGIAVRSGSATLIRRLLPLTDRDLGLLAAPAAARGADAQTTAELIARLACLVDDQPEINRVELPLSGVSQGRKVCLSTARDSADDPFLRRLPKRHHSSSSALR